MRISSLCHIFLQKGEHFSHLHFHLIHLLLHLRHFDVATIAFIALLLMFVLLNVIQKKCSRVLKEPCFEAARAMSILITFLQIATSTTDIFPGVSFPNNVMQYMRYRICQPRLYRNRWGCV